MNNPEQLPPIKLAFILDGKVVEIIHTDERFAAIFLSNPLVLDVTPKEGKEVEVHLNDGYEDGQFIHTAQE
jgi:hypothetical protein